MNNLTLRQLRYFEALAAHGHFGRAASACAISQPALSQQIKELEEGLGAALFERGPRKVTLTELGEALAPRIRAIVAGAEELGDIARAAGARLTGRLRLGVIPTIAPYFLPQVLRALRRSHGDLDIHVRETQTATLLRELKDGRLDAAILALPVSEPTLAEAPLFDEPFLLVRPARDAGAPPPDMGALREMRLLLLEEGHCFRDQALALCSMSAAAPRDGLDASSLSTLVQMVGAGVGVTLIPAMAEAVETRSADVAVTPLAGAAPGRTVGMVWRRSSPLAERMAEIAEAVAQA